ncbi:MAG: hypothetical protein WDA00_07180 [Eubacteriales bacterium]
MEWRSCVPHRPSTLDAVIFENVSVEITLAAAGHLSSLFLSDESSVPVAESTMTSTVEQTFVFADPALPVTVTAPDGYRDRSSFPNQQPFDYT